MFSAWFSSTPVLSDGAWGTELAARGLPAGASPDLWNLTNPDAVRAVAAGYVDAGSDVILTNTFQANRVSLAKNGAATQAAEVNRVGVALSKEAAAGRARVFASLGPSGALLCNGDIAEPELLAAFTEQAAAQAAGGADAIVVETMSEIAEARVAVAAARTTGLPVVASFAFDSGKNKDRTMMGSTPEQVAAAMEEAGASAVGANCGVGIVEAVAIARRFRAVTKLPLWIKPNAGLPQIVDGKAVWRTSPEDFAAHAAELGAAGATFIGACCGSNPAFIAALRRVFAR
jgi:methionine synthase I (cobalamin-dependent)